METVLYAAGLGIVGAGGASMPPLESRVFIMVITSGDEGRGRGEMGPTFRDIGLGGASVLNWNAPVWLGMFFKLEAWDGRVLAEYTEAETDGSNLTP